jgi:hypothetical protein
LRELISRLTVLLIFLQRSEPLIKETAMTTIAEMLIEKGKTAGIKELESLVERAMQ